MGVHICQTWNISLPDNQNIQSQPNIDELLKQHKYIDQYIENPTIISESLKALVLQLFKIVMSNHNFIP